MNYRSKFKHLVVSGCSYTVNKPSSTPWQWADMLADKTGMIIHNLACPSAGNSHISKSIILYLEQNNLDPADTLILAMWSQFQRIDWIIDSNINALNTDEYYRYDYNEYLTNACYGSALPFLRKDMNIQQKYRSIKSVVVDNWLQMQLLSDYLTNKHYTYFYTSFYNFKLAENIDKIFNQIDYIKELDELQLTFDNNNWIPLNDTEFYGDWCRKMNLLSETQHPYLLAPEQWPTEVLMPALSKLGILNKDA